MVDSVNKSVLCICENSNYLKIDGLDLWDKNRDVYNYTSSNVIIAHPPCQQWSKLKAFANDDIKERDLAAFCFHLVKLNGGVFEHTACSSFFKFIGADFSKIISVNQSWWGFPAKKPTYLYFENCKPLSYPLSFDLVQKKVSQMSYKKRSIMPLGFCKWLVECVS